MSQLLLEASIILNYRDHMQYNICTYGNPVLREKATSIKSFSDTLKTLADDMLQIMKEHNGIGLAAQQIGETIQICTVDLDPKYDIAEQGKTRLNPDIIMPLVLINPVIYEKTGRQTAAEACLSVPEISAPVLRAFEISVSCLNLKGEDQQFHIKGYMARVIQHEIDHLNGMLFVDRISPVKKISLSGKLKRLKKQYLLSQPK